MADMRILDLMHLFNQIVLLKAGPCGPGLRYYHDQEDLSQAEQ